MAGFVGIRNWEYFEDLLRGKAVRAILHLHGHWSRPESVILDPAAYALAAPVVQELLKSIRLSHTLLFVGCGAGLADPNWSTLLRWSREILAESRYRHFRLCRTEDLAALDRQHAPAERLFPVAYGVAFDDLAPFLRQLEPARAPASRLLPVPSRCFGRDEQIEALVGALCASPPRPVAVLGPPGVGKTTVTLMAFHDRRVAARFADRRYFVRCAAATNRATLLNALALALQVDLAPTGQVNDLEARVLARLSGPPALLLLDNAETPWEADLDGFEDLLSRLASLPQLALAGSLRGAERPFGPAWARPIVLDLLAPTAARDAFLAIAGDAHRSDPLLDPFLAEVGHLPLALVLLAAQAEGTPLSNLQHRWRQEKTRLLQRAGGGTADNSLELSISLSIHSPRLTLEAVCLATLLALLPDGMAAPDLNALEPKHGGESSSRLRKVGLALPLDQRLRLFSAIREVVASTLQPAAGDRERLVAHYFDLAKLGERAGAEGGAAAIERLGPELSNLEALLTPDLEGPAPEPAITAVRSLLELARFTGILQSSLFERGLAAARRTGSQQTLAEFLLRLGNLSLGRSYHDAARASYEEALPLFRKVGDPLGEASCVRRLGDIALRRSDHDGARDGYEKALALYRLVGDLLGEANCIRRLGDIALRCSDHDDARAHFEGALPLFRRVGDLLGEAKCIKKLGDLALRRSDHTNARARYEEALPLFRRIGDLLGEANCIRSLGDLAQLSDYEAAHTLYDDALPLFRRVGDLLGEANCIQSLGDIALQCSDHVEARARSEEALRLYRRFGDLLGEANCIQSLGDIALVLADHDTARARYEEALALYRRIGDLFGEANCLQGLGDIALGVADRAKTLGLFEKALQLYLRLPEPYSVGLIQRRLARLAVDEAERRHQHVSAARTAWQAIKRSDLVADLDREFPPGGPC